MLPLYTILIIFGFEPLYQKKRLFDTRTLTLYECRFSTSLHKCQGTFAASLHVTQSHVLMLMGLLCSGPVQRSVETVTRGTIKPQGPASEHQL